MTYEPHSRTVQGLSRQERLARKNVATEGLLWLYLTLQFLFEALRSDTPKLPDAFRQAYERTLKKYHSTVMAYGIGKLWSNVTDRETFYEKLGDNDEQVREALQADTQALKKIVDILGKFLKSTDPNGRPYDDKMLKE